MDQHSSRHPPMLHWDSRKGVLTGNLTHQRLQLKEFPATQRRMPVEDFLCGGMQSWCKVTKGICAHADLRAEPGGVIHLVLMGNAKTMSQNVVNRVPESQWYQTMYWRVQAPEGRPWEVTMMLWGILLQAPDVAYVSSGFMFFQMDFIHVWFDLFFLFPYSSILSWECLLWAILCRNYITCLLLYNNSQFDLSLRWNVDFRFLNHRSFKRHFKVVF